MNDETDDKSETAEPPSGEKRPVGRPKGLPRTGGRPKGAKGRLPAQFREFIDARGRPLEFLAALARGNQVTAADPSDPSRKIKVYPTIDQRERAARALLDRLLPALKAVEMKEDKRLQINFSAEDAALMHGPPDPRETDLELARKLAFLLSKGVHSQAAMAADASREAARSAPPRQMVRGPSGGWVEKAEPTPPAALPAPGSSSEPHEEPLEGEVLDAEGFAEISPEETLADGRVRWALREGGKLTATSFDRGSLSARTRAARKA